MSEIYRPSKWQSEFHALPHDEALGAGSAGPGKTEALLMEPLAQIVAEHKRCENPEHPHHMRWGDSTGHWLYLRRQAVDLDQTWSRLLRVLPRIDPNVKIRVSDRTFEFSSGFKYELGHCKDKDDWSQYYSKQFTGVSWDELVQFEQVQWTQINSRVRSYDPVLRPMMKIRAMSNPIGGVKVENPFWVRDYFVEDAPEGRRTMKKKLVMPDGEIVWKTRIYLPARLSDNPNPEFVREYTKKLIDLPSHLRRALFDGDWYVVAGSFFADSWNPRLHVCRPFKIPDDWPRFRSMDWGFKAPGCIHWYALDPEGTLWVERELTFQNKTATEVAGFVKDVEKEMGLWSKYRSGITGPADTQLWERRGETGMSKAQEFAKEGVLWQKADKRSRQRNAEHIVKRLRDHRNETQTPGLVIFDTCRKLISTLPSIQAEEGNPEIPADGGNDHWFDSLSYGCAYASRGHVGMTPLMSDDEEDEYHGRDDNRGRYGYG